MDETTDKFRIPEEERARLDKVFEKIFGTKSWRGRSQEDRDRAIESHYYSDTFTVISDWFIPLALPSPDNDRTTNCAALYFHMYNLTGTLEKLWTAGNLELEKYKDFMAALAITIKLRDAERSKKNYRAPKFIEPVKKDNLEQQTK